jgi:methyl coenzyme M reductase beta subunit
LLTRAEADLAKSALDAAGIESIITTENVGGFSPQMMGRPIELVMWNADPRAFEILGDD